MGAVTQFQLKMGLTRLTDRQKVILGKVLMVDFQSVRSIGEEPGG